MLSRTYAGRWVPTVADVTDADEPALGRTLRVAATVHLRGGRPPGEMLSLPE